MLHVYVLINCDMGTEEPTIQKLKEVNLVKEVWGTFDSLSINSLGFV